MMCHLIKYYVLGINYTNSCLVFIVNPLPFFSTRIIHLFQVTFNQIMQYLRNEIDSSLSLAVVI